MKQELQEAYNLVSTVCAQFSGNLDAHTRLQAALKVIRDAIEKPEKKKK